MKNFDDILDSINREFEKREKLREKIKNNIEFYLNEVLKHCLEHNNFIDNESIFYNDKLSSTSLKEYFDLLCDELLGYGEINYLLYSLNEIDSSVVCKYKDKFIEVRKVIGQGTFISFSIIDENNLEGREYFTFEQYKDNYVFDTLNKRLSIAKEEIEKFLKDIEDLDLSKEDIINIIKSI